MPAATSPLAKRMAIAGKHSCAGAGQRMAFPPNDLGMKAIRDETREDVILLMLEQPLEQLYRDGHGMVVAHPQIQAKLVGHAMPDKVLCDIGCTADISHSSQYTIHLNACRQRRQQIP